MRTWYTPPTPAQVEEAATFLAASLANVDLRFARPAPRRPAAHPSLTLARQRGLLRLPGALRGTALRFGEFFHVGECVDPLWSGAEVMYRPGSLTQSICRIRDGREPIELRLNHAAGDVLLDTAGGALNLRLSDDLNRVLVRLDGADCADAQAAIGVILAGDFRGWSLQNVPREFRQVSFRKFIIDRADVLELSAVHIACCPRCPILAEDAPPRRRPQQRPAHSAAVAQGGQVGNGRILASAGGRCRVASARGDARPSGGWSGQRVELNAFPSPRFIEFVEHQFMEVGVAKVVPDSESLERAFHRAWIIGLIQDAMDEAMVKIPDGVNPAMPRGLPSKIARIIKETGKSWDEALAEMVREMRAKRAGQR
jgi:hypothetical protein